MRKIFHSLIVMLIVTMFGFNASAATIQATINIDNPSVVEAYQMYYDDNWNYLRKDFNLIAGDNNVTINTPPWDSTSASITLVIANGVSFTSLTLNGAEEETEWDIDGVHTISSITYGSRIVIRTSGGGSGEPVSKPHVTINVDNASAVEVFPGEMMKGTNISLNDGYNYVEFTAGTTFKIRNAAGVDNPLQSVKHNETEIAHVENQPYEITPADGDVIDIVAGSNAPVITTYTLTLSGDLNAISKITKGGPDGDDIGGWSSGTATLEEGPYFVTFDESHYEISNITVNGVSQNYYEGSATYFYLGGNTTFSFTASAKTITPTPAKSATFTLVGWDGNGLIINLGTSSWDSEIEFSSSQFTVNFDGNEDGIQNYCIHTTGDYRISKIRKTHYDAQKEKDVTTNIPAISAGLSDTVIEVEDGDRIEITVYKYVDVYTATLNVTADLTNFDGDITLRNATGHVSTGIYGGTTQVKFNPNNSSDRNFTLSSGSKTLYSVKYNGNTVTGSNGSYSFSNVTDNSTIEIIAADPNADPNAGRTPATLIFDETNMTAAIRTVQVANEDIEASAWTTDLMYQAYVGDRIVIYFNEGYKISNLVFGNTTYNYNPAITGSQPLEYYSSAEIYMFNQNITAADLSGNGQVVVSFEAEAPQATIYNKTVTFTVNIPAGVKITEVTDSQNPVNIPVSGASFTHTFTSEYDYASNFIDIQSEEGYNLVSVTVNDGVNTPHTFTLDADVNLYNTSVGDNYAISIVVEANSTGNEDPEYGTFTVNVIGDPAQIKFEDLYEDEEVTLSVGDNTISLNEDPNFRISPIGDSIESVTHNGDVLTPNSKGKYSIKNIEAGDVVVITTVGAVPPVVPTFTLRINEGSDVAKVGTLTDYDTRSEINNFVIGDNIINLPNATGMFQYMLSAESVLYSVKLNDETISPSYASIYMFSVKAGDVLEIDTEFPQTNATVSWSFIGCDNSVITAIQVNNGTKYSADDEDTTEFEALLNGFTVNTADILAYWLDTTNFNITSVTVNGVENGTNGYQYFGVTEDVTIAITAQQKRVFNYTLNTNNPAKLAVYQGTYGMGQPLEITESTVLEASEILGTTCITVGAAYGYEFVEANCTMDNIRLTLGSEGYYTITPEENSVINIEIREVDRPYTAVLYVDDFEDIAALSLASGRFEAYNSSETMAEPGYTVFHFNNIDRGDGFKLTIVLPEEDSEVQPIVYVNNELRTLNVSGQIEGLMLNHGDVIKVYTTKNKPQMHSLTFYTESDNDKFTVHIDCVQVSSPVARSYAPARAEGVEGNTLQALTGSEIRITASKDTNAPWVKVDSQDHPLKPGESYTFTATGNHNIDYGENYTPTGVDNVIANIAGASTADIYTLQGICIKRNATGNDIKNLKPGLYIIGGHKVLVK